MKIAVFGLGYVGTVSAACLADAGHDVIGVDPSSAKTEAIAAGRSPILEPGIEPIIAAAVAEGRLTVTDDPEAAVAASDISLICVGTPGHPSGSLDLQHVETVCQEIGNALADSSDYHIVAVRSTLLPGSTHSVVIPTLEARSGRTVGVDFGVSVNPEFLREGTAVSDYRNPPKTVIGASDARTGDTVALLYTGLDAPVILTDLAIAEMTKYADNAWHAVKVTFANEIGRMAKALGLDGHQVMDFFVQDTKLNISPQYLRPGFAFGGSCLPKDLAALTHRAKMMDVDLPMLSSVLSSNAVQIDVALDMILQRGNQRVGLLGLSFKPRTDDLRQSPLVELAERLLGKGYDLRIYDPAVNLTTLVGANREYILDRLPHIANLLVDSIEEVLVHAESIIIGHADPRFVQITGRLRSDQFVIDLVGIDRVDGGEDRYDGIGW
jgi:GDP-mannose 6-dehydrogenase